MYLIVLHILALLISAAFAEEATCTDDNEVLTDEQGLIIQRNSCTEAESKRYSIIDFAVLVLYLEARAFRQSAKIMIKFFSYTDEEQCDESCNEETNRICKDLGSFSTKFCSADEKE